MKSVSDVLFVWLHPTDNTSKTAELLAETCRWNYYK